VIEPNLAGATATAQHWYELLVADVAVGTGRSGSIAILECMTTAEETPTNVSAACGKCGLALDEPPGTPPDERRPCPRCGSNSRRFGVELHSTVNVTASLVVEVIRKDVMERHWPWLLLLLVGTVTSAVVGGLAVSGWISVAVSLAFAAILFLIGLRAIKTVRRIEKYPPT
jgi:hypothetical protein